MPLDANLAGEMARVSPQTTHAILPWTMNFAAAAEAQMTREYYDNSGGKVPLVHPLFLASVTEVVGAWSALYTGGVSKKEVVKHTFVHHSFDAEYTHVRINADDTITTEVQLAGVGDHRAGSHFLTKYKHVNQKGECVSNSWWGGVVLGLKAVNGSKYVSNVKQRPQWPKDAKILEEVEMEFPATQAHLWDACIRDPLNAKPPSANINAHTDLALALKGGLDGRTLNGICVLSFALGNIMKRYPSARVVRIGCFFASPLYLNFEPVKARLQIASVSKEDKLVTVLFHVLNAEGNKAVKNGYVVLDTNATAQL